MEALFLACGMDPKKKNDQNDVVEFQELIINVRQKHISFARSTACAVVATDTHGDYATDGHHCFHARVPRARADGAASFLRQSLPDRKCWSLALWCAVCNCMRLCG